MTGASPTGGRRAMGDDGRSDGRSGDSHDGPADSDGPAEPRTRQHAPMDVAPELFP
jgi:hypothetical protein